MDLGLNGLKAVVTGGTKGIGRAIVETLAKEGAHVSFCARSQQDVDDALNLMHARGLKVDAKALDIADAMALSQWVVESSSAMNGIDIVVANVSALAIGADEESWKKGFDVDMMGTVRLVNAAMPSLEQSKHPSIVTISRACK